MDPEFDPSLCPTCFFHTSLSPPTPQLICTSLSPFWCSFLSSLPTSLAPLVPSLTMTNVVGTRRGCCRSGAGGGGDGWRTVWLWVAHCSIASAHGRCNGGGFGCNRNKVGCGISPNDSEHGSLRPSSHQRQLHAPGGDMAVHGVVLGAVCRVG